VGKLWASCGSVGTGLRPVLIKPSKTAVDFFNIYIDIIQFVMQKCDIFRGNKLRVILLGKLLHAYGVETLLPAQLHILQNYLKRL
jgi:hypothetical protein